MIRVSFDTAAAHERLPFYLAMEEWAARHLPRGEYFFTWRVAPTVICGRNQDIAAEVDLAYCRERGIDVCRRKSGGGCVYADMDNLMVSCVLPTADVQAAFAAYARRLANALKRLGLDAEPSGRNDVTIGGRKVSGCAYYHMPGLSIAHGTMLLSTDMGNMMRAITPSRAKLESKRVQSVQSRVTTIAEHLPGCSMRQLVDAIEGELMTGEARLSPADVAEVRAMAQAYDDPAWLAIGGRSPRAVRERRIEGVGTIGVDCRLNEGVIESVALDGDFFLAADLEPVLAALRGRRPAEAAKALSPFSMASIIPGLDNEAFADLLAQAAG